MGLRQMILFFVRPIKINRTTIASSPLLSINRYKLEKKCLFSFSKSLRIKRVRSHSHELSLEFSNDLMKVFYMNQNNIQRLYLFVHQYLNCLFTTAN